MAASLRSAFGSRARRDSAGAIGDAGLVLLGDQPHADGDDPLEFDRIAESLSTLILSSQASTPFTLGIEAGWGKGKSTLMRKLERSLAAEPQVSTVWFNAWTSEQGTALEGLIKAVLDALDPSLLRRTARNKRLMSWLRIVATTIAGWLKLGTIANAIWDEIAVDPKARNDMRDLMVDVMREWSDRRPPGTASRLLLVFIDDLDRCAPASVLQVFEAIKLYLDAPGFVFIIGYDRDVVSDVILDVKHYTDSQSSHHYLEKVVQIVYRVPEPGDAGVGRLIDLYLDSSRTEALFDAAARSLVVEQTGRNPRRVKRFINAFLLEYGLDSEWSELGPDTLVRVLILDFYFPQFAARLRSRSARDPVDEFERYTAVRDVLRRRVPRDDDQAWTHVASLFGEYGLALPDEQTLPEELLRQIESELPETFPELARNRDFLPLIQGFGDEDARERLREKLRRYSPTLLQAAPPASTTPTVFISYRRDDASAYAGRLFDRLSERFSEGAILMDVRLEPGGDWVAAAESAVAAADIGLVIIGPQWATSTDVEGKLRLHDPGDVVRREVAAMLNSPQTRTVPVLVHGARVPTPQELPEDVNAISRLNALELSDTRWDYDVARLIDLIESVSASKAVPEAAVP
jgi:hypothetical protein